MPANHVSSFTAFFWTTEIKCLQLVHSADWLDLDKAVQADVAGEEMQKKPDLTLVFVLCTGNSELEQGDHGDFSILEPHNADKNPTCTDLHLICLKYI